MGSFRLRTHVDMNAAVLVPAAEIWVEIFDFEASGNSPRVFPLRMVLGEARLCR